MTVIAYKDGMLCADSQISRGDERAGHVRKIRKTDRGLAGAAGNASAVSAFLRWFADGEKCDSIPKYGDVEFTAIVIRNDGRMLEYDEGMNPYPYEHGFAALGSGSAYALGAMSAGADARRAVEIAMEHCTSCGGRIDVLRLAE